MLQVTSLPHILININDYFTQLLNLSIGILLKSFKFQSQSSRLFNLQ